MSEEKPVFDIQLPVLPHAPTGTQLAAYYHSLPDSETLTVVGTYKGKKSHRQVKVGPRDTLGERIMSVRAVIEFEIDVPKELCPLPLTENSSGDS